jgi:riboflavin kinase / FMN adenylyltransferase
MIMSLGSAGLVGNHHTTIVGLENLVPEPSVVAIGFFDGVHRGHQNIIQRAMHQSRLKGIRSVVITFDRHPMELTCPERKPELLMTQARRLNTIAALGPDLVLVLKFNEEMSTQSPEKFVNKVLLDALKTRHVVVGENFHFGFKARGDVDMLADIGKSAGFTIEGVPLFKEGMITFSSTAIRMAVTAGEVEKAKRILGRPHLVDVSTINDQWDSIQKTDGIRLSPHVAIPKTGFYIGRVIFGDMDGKKEDCLIKVIREPNLQELKLFGFTSKRLENFNDWIRSVALQKRILVDY